MGIDQTFFTGPPRADLNKQDFDTLIRQKGRDVILETALQCPCKSESTNQQSNCRNCDGIVTGKRSEERRVGKEC